MPEDLIREIVSRLSTCHRMGGALPGGRRSGCEFPRSYPSNPAGTVQESWDELTIRQGFAYVTPYGVPTRRTERGVVNKERKAEKATISQSSSKVLLVKLRPFLVDCRAFCINRLKLTGASARCHPQMVIVGRISRNSAKDYPCLLPMGDSIAHDSRSKLNGVLRTCRGRKSLASSIQD